MKHPTPKKDRKVIVIRGISGSGKSTFAEYIANLHDGVPPVICTADDYFTDNTTGEYKFDASHLGNAHKACMEKFTNACQGGASLVILANTSTQEREISGYMDAAEEHGYQIFSIVLENRHGNKDIHNVPEKTLNNQAQNLLNSLKLR